jgi:pyruvate-formate lyase
MAAIEKFVFEEEMVTLPQLVEILKNNWEGNQVLQMKMINEGAKFGNGQKEAGNLACEMVNYFVERVEAYNSRYGDLIFSPCIATFSWIVNIGKRIGASADGRMSKDPIAANMSPVLSRDVSGPMAALNSNLKLSTDSLE